jgi:hypothetical protein
MKFLRLPSGNKAPMYASIWEITVGEDVSKSTGKKYFSFCGGGARWKGWITPSIKTELIAPARENKQALLSAPIPDDVESGSPSAY